MIDLVEQLLTLAFIAQVLHIAVPYVLAALGGVMSERSGVINIALEGKLLIGAFCAALGAYYSGSVAVGFLAGIAGGVAVAAVYALVTVYFRADQIVAGIAINLFAVGATRYFLKLATGSTANSPLTPGFGTNFFWGELGVPVPELFAIVTLIVGILAVVGVIYFVIYKTPFGLRLRAVGEHPGAADSLGVSVARIRVSAVLIAGALAGLGGAWLALSSRRFVAEMTGGLGYIALAAVIMGKWRPRWAALACLLFASAKGLEIALQGTSIPIPGELIHTLPYLLTMVALAGFIGRSRPPAALGQPD